MDTNLAVCLELTYEYARKTYIACVDYCLSNGNISLLSIVGEPQFVMTVDDNFNILGRWNASLSRPFVYIY